MLVWPTHIVLCVSFACLRLVSCIKWCLANIVLYFLFCLSSSCVLCMVVSNTFCAVFFILFVFVLCLVHGGVQHIYSLIFIGVTKLLTKLYQSVCTHLGKDITAVCYDFFLSFLFFFYWKINV